MKKLISLFFALLPVLAMTAQEIMVDVSTTLGDFRVKLYDDTPLHRDNFIKLVKDGAYDGVLFHRVIKDFMVQAGDPNSKDSTSTMPLGASSIGDQIPAEIRYPAHYHKYGALAAARTNNPQKLSSGSQFYIVTGHKFDRESVTANVLQSLQRTRVMEMIHQNEADLRTLQAEQGREAVNAKIGEFIAQAEAEIKEAPEEIVNDYVTLGGTPHLDGEYTVFGEVVSGMDTVEKIQNVETGAMDLPKTPVRIISMKVCE